MTRLSDVSRISVGISEISAQKRWILITVDETCQSGFPLVRVGLVYDELAQRVTGKNVFQDVERESENFRSCKPFVPLVRKILLNCPSQV